MAFAQMLGTSAKAAAPRPAAAALAAPCLSRHHQHAHHHHNGVVCRAEGNGAPIVSGPVAVGAADAASAAKQPADRAKGLWTRCDKCGVILYVKHLKEHHHVCFSCSHHLKMTSAERIEHLIDPGTWRPLDESLSPMDPLEFTDQKAYPERVRDSQKKTGLQDALRTGTGMLHGVPVALGVMEFGFMGGSMGSVVGEKLTRLIEHATQEGLALIIVSTSGGARMQEGIMSLMQMAKISAALHVHQNEANLLFISLLTSPTTGGVTASFGMLGDVLIAEPQAIIGFAGRRVIEQTLNEKLPDDFQTAEYLLEKGLLDLVVPRAFLKGALYEIIDFYRGAPYKARGQIPFGVQRGSYALTAEEKMRRRWREWGGDEAGGALPAAASGAAPSYQALVESFRRVVAADGGASGGASGETDVRGLVGDGDALGAALAVAKESVVEWLEVEEDAAAAEAAAAQKKFLFTVKAP